MDLSNVSPLNLPRDVPRETIVSQLLENQLFINISNLNQYDIQTTMGLYETCPH